VVDALSAGPRAIERRDSVIAVLIAAVDEGRAHGGKAARDLPSLAAEGVVGAVFSVIYARVLRLRAGVRAEPSFLGLLNELMGMIVTPYLGAAAARRELTRPLPSARVHRRHSSDPLRDLDMRLTYRTIRVLAAVAANPGASNRRISEAADVSDQGQISKLLARLQHLGLIDNTGDGAVKGEPNSWTLTATGAEVEHAIGGASGDRGVGDWES